MSIDQEKPVLRLAPQAQRATAPTSPPVSAVQVVRMSPREVLALHCGQADELAAMVESEMAEENAHHLAQVHRMEEARRVLDERHQRRIALLAGLADALGAQNVDFDEAAHRLAGGG